MKLMIKKRKGKREKGFSFRSVLVIACVVFPCQFFIFDSFGEDWTQHIIKQEDRSFDFKSVAKGATAEHRFVLNNPFEDTLHLKSIESSCLCTMPILEGNKQEIKTYEEAVITAQFRSDVFEGKRNATICVMIDKPNRAEILLNIQGDIRTDVKVSPHSVQFGQVKAGEEHMGTFTVNYTGQNSNWRILEIKSGNENIKAEITETKMQLGIKTFKVSVTLNGKSANGHIAENIYLITNDTSAGREIPIRVQATVGSVITVTPQTVFLGSFKADKESPVKNAVVRGTNPFKITKITCENPAVKIPFEINPDAPPKVMYLLPIQYKNTETGAKIPEDGIMQAKVEIETDNAELKPAFYVTAKIGQE